MSIPAARRFRAFRAILIPPVVAFLVLLLPGAGARGSISIEPAFVTARLDKGNVSEVVVIGNNDASEGHYRVQVRHFIYTLEGGVRTIDPDEHSLAQWIKTNPREFTLGPNAKRVVRLAIVPPPRLSPGEYWAALEFEPLEGKTSTASDSSGRTVSFKVISTVYVPVIGTVGEATHQGELREVTAFRKPKGIQVAAVVANAGTGRLRLKGNCQILDSSGAVVAERAIGEATVLPGGVRRFMRVFSGDEAPASAIRARVAYTSDQLGQPLTGEAVIEIAPADLPDSTRADSLHGANAGPPKR
jgi:hypothetical protein